MRVSRLPVALTVFLLVSCGGGGGGGGSPPPPVGDGTFRPAVPPTASVGDGARASATGDFNADGIRDLVVVNNNSGGGDPSPKNLSILRGTGGGAFTAFSPAIVSTGSEPSDVVVADFNRDGRADLAVLDGGVSVLLGNGNGTFASPLHPTVVGTPGAQHKGLGVGDFNGDGRADLRYASWTANGDSTYSYLVSTLLGAGDGSFASAGSVEVWRDTATFLPQLWSIVAGDFDGDGDLDLAAALAGSGSPLSDSVRIALNNGAGILTLVPTALPIEGAIDLTSGDLNGDGMGDLAVVNINDGAVRVMLAAGGGAFTDAAPPAIGGLVGATWIISADFDGNGLTDLAVYATAGLSVFLGNGAGQFTPSVQGPFGSSVAGDSATIAADLDGDGILDLAIANWDGYDNASDTVSIYLGNPQ